MSGVLMCRHVSAFIAALTLPLLLAAAPTTQKTDAKSDAKSDAQADPYKALARKIPDVNFNQVQLGDAIDYVREVSGTNIHVNWRALELLNVTRQTPVSVRLNSVSTRRVLRSLLDESGAGELLTFYVDDGVLEITTREIADNQMLTRVYPVQDLVATVPNFAGPSFNLENQGTQTSGGGGGSGGAGGSLLGSSTVREQDVTPQQRADDLVKAITQTVRPDAWRDNGGTASIRYFNGHLIVTAPRSIHEAITGRAQ
jgi:hypothetical protein